MAGQFDKYLQQQILEAGVESDAVEPATLARGPIIRPGAVAAPGLALDGGSPLVRGTDTGGPANAADVPGVAVAATQRKKNLSTAAAGAVYREKTRARSAEQREGLATTTMRMVNGQAVDMDEVKPPKAKPVSNLLSKGYVKPNTSASSQIPDFKEITNPLSADDAARMMDPGKEDREAKYAADAATEATRQDMLSGERAFNDSQAKSGSTLRSVNGITYDSAELETSRQAGLKGSSDGGFDPEKYRTYEKEKGEVDSILDGRAKFVPSTGKKNIKKDTKNAQANGVTETSVIPKTTLPSKGPLDREQMGETRVSSIIPTAPQLEGLGNTGAIEDRDVDNYEASKKEGKTKQTTMTGPGEDGSGPKQTVTGKVKESIKEDADYKAEQARLAASKTKNEDSEEDKVLTAQGQADVKKTRSEKGQRNAKAVKVDSRTVPFDQQDLWDAEGNVKPEYQDGPSSTTMVAKKNWDIQPTYKSPELQAAHEKRQAYSADVESHISDSLGKHIATNYSSPEESRAAFATLQKKHVELRASVDKFHPVPAGGYFNDKEDTSSTSYEEMPGVKIQPSPQPQNVKDDSNVVPERYLNDMDTTSDAQLAVDDRNAARNRTAVTRTRQMDFNKIASRPERGRSDEQELVDLSKAAARNQELEKLGKKLQTHSPEVMFRARLSAEAAGVPASVYNSPTFHQHPDGRSHVRDAYLQDAAQVGDDAESQAKMTGFAGKNENEANDRKDAAYTFLQNRERFNNSKAPGTGYRYNAGLNNLDIKSDSFRASNGDIVPFSQTEHPEHPGFDLEGSHVGFMGSVPSGVNPDGTPAYAPLTHPQTGEDLHEGWHPYKINGKRVFEKHSIPENAIHHGDIMEQGIQNGESPSATLRKLEQGKESAITVEGLAINQQPSAPIKGAGGFDPKPLPKGPDFSGVPVTQGEGLPKPELNMEDTWTSRRGQLHAKHEESGTLVHGCRACSQKASQASRDNAANIAGTFIPPSPRRGVGTADNSVRPFTEAERAGKASIPTVDDSKTKVFTDVPKKPGDALAKVAADTRASLGHPELDDIIEAKRSGNIDVDEAYELAADAGHFRGAKPRFTKVEE